MLYNLITLIWFHFVANFVFQTGNSHNNSFINLYTLVCVNRRERKKEKLLISCYEKIIL